jgi:hypothetical protein
MTPNPSNGHLQTLPIFGAARTSPSGRDIDGANHANDAEGATMDVSECLLGFSALTNFLCDLRTSGRSN